MSHRQPFLNIRTEGSLLPSDLLSRLMEGTNLPGLKPEDYNLGAGEKLNEAISRSWTRLLSLWLGFRKAKAALPASDLGTTLTRERWLLQLFQELGYGRLIGATPFEIDEKTYPISHVWQGQYYQVPIHLVSFRADLDKRSEQRIQGASKASPHGMVQEFLNRSVHDLWAFVSNGLKLLILRDNASLTRQAYVEFDLEGIFEGEAYADFRLLWMVCHQSRLEGTAENRPETCWLEAWSKQAQTDGRRALDQLRVGVEKALENLGTGFISHKANQNLCQRLKAGELQKQDLYRQLLRLVYRLIFLFVAEDRDLLHFPGASDEARLRYARFYSGQRLRRMAERTRGSRHADLWVGLRLVFARLGDDRGCPELGLPALGGFLFGPEAMLDLESAELSNEYLLQAIRNLGLVKDRSGWRLVDYRNLGSEELGSVYESLLELNPTMELEAGVFSLGTVAGNQRKTSGSYYTPDSLVQCLLDSALDPVVEQAINGKTSAEAEKAILALKVCDPAVGSGHFLVGAAHRLAKHLAQVRAQAQGESEPSPLYYQHSLRDVIGHCLYGVDVNPMAAELCRVSLWLEAIEPGKPLSFLDHHIRVGNSLLGATPALLAKGIPDEAFTPIEGDDKEICSRFKKVNKTEKIGYRRLFAATTEPWERLEDLAASMVRLDSAPDDSIEAVRNKEKMYEAMVRSGNYLDGQFWADTWCAAFVWKKTQEFNHPITEEDFRRIERNPHAVDKWMRDEIVRLSQQYQFFHWHLAFPDVFHVPVEGRTAENERTGWSGGFDVVLGNPPWERIKLQEKEWFANRNVEIAKNSNKAARERLIRALKDEDAALHNSFLDALRVAECESALIRNSGRYPLCARGDLNTYAIFAENTRALLAASGRMGMIVPSGIATDNTTREFFADIVGTNRLVSLYDFENAVGLFEGVGHGRFKFCLLTIAGSSLPSHCNADFFFFAHFTEDLIDQDRHFTLSPEDISLINPNTRTCPIFRSKRDAEITKKIYRLVPVLIKSGTPEVNPWGVRFATMFHMSSASHLFVTRDQAESNDWRLVANEFCKGDRVLLPLYEAKMMHQFTHRYGDYAMQPKGSEDTELPRISPERLNDPSYMVLPRYWIDRWEVVKSLAAVPKSLIDGCRRLDESAVQEALRLWISGYVINKGDSGIHLRLRSCGLDLLCATILPGSQDWSIASRLEEDYPLSEIEFAILVADDTLLAKAENLISIHTPKWLIGFRDITNATNERTSLAAILPSVGVGNSLPLIFSNQPADLSCLLAANLNSLVFDYVARQTIAGTHMNFFLLMQLPVLPPTKYTSALQTFISLRVVELSYTASDLAAFASELGFHNSPFRWDEERRLQLKCELDALFFHLYEVPIKDVQHILETFPIVKRNDIKRWGEYRTKRIILEVYDAMAEAARNGIPYQTLLSPPPADLAVAHSLLEQIIRVAPVTKDPFSDINALPDEAWATPFGVTPENVALFSLIDVVRNIGEAIDPERVRLAAILVRKPVLAAAFMDDAQAREWFRLIGQEARPVRGNVVQISQFQKNGVDYPWAEAIRQLRGSGALVVDSDGKWSAGVRMPASSWQDWITGRVAIAVQLLSAIDPARVEQKLIAFNRSVEDGTARRAVS